jgi:multiple sugar transport system ATP-binding protein
MGRAIVRDPQVFLYDEPLSNLDAKLRVAMRSELKELHQRLKTTSIYVTHDQIEAMTMGDRIVVMKDGRIEQIGSPLELYDFPVNIFVAGFIGSPAMNFLPGTLRRNGAGAELELADGTRLQAPLNAGGSDGQSVVRTAGAPAAAGGGGPVRVVVLDHRCRHLRRLPARRPTAACSASGTNSPGQHRPFPIRAAPTCSMPAAATVAA